ncbi:carboxymuconolactone decarboxylase family protein, partial [Jeotgalicoccus huakuii]|nr:carboxymuconolactone decarboxylase family protein [Jeotgalicoccus huakuii]
KNSLTPAEREVAALAASEVNGCDYCVAAHSFFGGKTGLNADDLLAARAGTLNGVAALARAVTLSRGQVSDEHLSTAREAG